MATIWFSSDHHFHHANIIKYASRPFRDVREMDEFLVEQHNIYVQPQDHWYCLGDVTMERDGQGRGLEILRRMNGHKRLIMGNHDHYPVQRYLHYFEKVMAMNRIEDLWFTHVPVHPENLGTCHANVHGHIHQNPSPPPVSRSQRKWDGGPRKELVERLVPYINVSVEAINYHPVDLDWLKEKCRAAARP